MEDEQEEQLRPMDARIGEWIIDFMNMIFGPAENEETRDFWEQVLFPELYSHYNYMIRERLEMFERNLNALFFAICE